MQRTVGGRLPGTVVAAAAIALLHVLLSLIFLPAAPVWAVPGGVAWGAVAYGLAKGRSWALPAGLLAAGIGFLFDLFSMRIVSTNLAVLILLLTPSAKNFLAGGPTAERPRPRVPCPECRTPVDAEGRFCPACGRDSGRP